MFVSVLLKFPQDVSGPVKHNSFDLIIEVCLTRYAYFLFDKKKCLKNGKRKGLIQFFFKKI